MSPWKKKKSLHSHNLCGGKSNMNFTANGDKLSHQNGNFPGILNSVMSSVQSSVMSDSLWPHGLQHARPPWLSPTPETCSNSSPSSWWCHIPICLSSESCKQTLTKQQERDRDRKGHPDFFFFLTFRKTLIC